MSTATSKVEEERRSKLWRERVYSTRYLTELPRVYRLSEQLLANVDYATSDQLIDCRRMIVHAAQTGDNVGTDEFPDDDSYDLFFGTSEMFAVTDKCSSRLVSFIAITPSPYARGLDTCLANLVVFRSPEIAGDWTAFRSLIRLAVQLTIKLELGYCECVYNATLTNRQLMSALRAEQFTVKAILRDGVNLAGLGLRENVIMTRNLGLPARSPRPLVEIQSTWEKFLKANPSLVGPPDFDYDPPPTLGFLPRFYTFTSGLRCKVRSAVEDDIPQLYAIMTAATRRGQGYALNEFPSLDSFRRLMLVHNPCVVYEDCATGDMVGYSIITNSCFVRTRISGIAETDTMVNEKYRGNRVGSDIVYLELTIMKEIGYKTGINDAMMSNLAMINLLRRGSGQVPHIMVGSIPMAAYHPPESATGKAADSSAGEWVDAVLGYYPFDKLVPTFTQLADENASVTESASQSSKL